MRVFVIRSAKATYILIGLSKLPQLSPIIADKKSKNM